MGIFLKKTRLYIDEKQLAQEQEKRTGYSTWLYYLVLIPTISIRNNSHSFEIRIAWLCYTLYFVIEKEIWCTQIDERTEEEKKTSYGSYKYVRPKIKEIYKKKYHFFRQGPF